MGSVELTTTLVARGLAAAIVLGDEQAAAIGEGAKRFPVRATVNGYSWRKTGTPMGGKRRVTQALEMLRDGTTLR